LITTGAILGYKIIPIPEPEIVAVSSLHAYSPVAEEGKVQLLIEGEVINQGSGETLPNVKIVITPESGGAVITENSNLANDSVTSWFSAIYLATGAKASFKYEKEYTTSELPLGNYSVDVYIMKSNLLDSPFMSQKLGERHTKLKVIDNSMIGMIISNPHITEVGTLKENYANISLELNQDVIVDGQIIIIHWRNSTWLPLPNDKLISQMTQQSGNNWTLYEKWDDLWRITDVYEFRIIVPIQIAGETYEVITSTIEIIEPS
jgi:hypothetical protein